MRTPRVLPSSVRPNRPKNPLIVLTLLAGAGMAGCQAGREPGDPTAEDGRASVERSGAPSALPGLPRFSDAARPDSGPPLVVTREVGALLLTVDARDGDQINALLPPYLETSDGRRLQFGASAVTEDSAYFIGQVTARVGESLLPLRGTLHTSYCRAGENLCRSAKRAVRVDE